MARRRLCSWLLAIACLTPLLAAHQASAITTASPLEEEIFGDDVWFGGRSLAVAVSPANKQTAIEAAETGGLFRTLNGGASWSRLSGFGPFRTADVLYDPANANVVLATARDDAKNPSQAGIWRSNDGGLNWTRVAAAASPCTDFKGLAAAPVSPTWMFAASNCGVFSSATGGGVGAWGPFFPAILANTADVAATTEPTPTTGVPRAVAYACGGQGLSKGVPAIAPNMTWNQVSSGYPASGVPCSVDVSPQNPNVVFVTNRNCAAATCAAGEKFVNRIYEFKISGTTSTWRELAQTPTAPARGGRPPYVVTHNSLDGHAGHYDVYWGTGVATYRQHCSAGASTGECVMAAETVCNEAAGSARDEDGDGVANEGCPLVGSGAELDGEGDCKDLLDNDGDGRVNDGCPIVDRFDNGTHVDPSHIAFDPTVPNKRGCPLLVSNDGGMGRSTDCGANWVDSNSGRRALQIYNVYGTSRGTAFADTDLYFGTQDNGTWYSLDNAFNWSRANGIDGIWGMVDRTVPPGGVDDIRIVQEICGACRQDMSKRGYQETSPFPLPPGGWANGGWKAMTSFGPQRYAQFGYQLDAAGQITSSRLYVMQPETGPACGNAVDDDFDGAVNDGCAAVGNPETGNACHGAGDFDGDGAINDGCSHINSPETGTECGSGVVDNDGDGVVNDGCPRDGAAESGADCLDTDDGDGDGKANDGCPETGVWGPMGPFISASFGGLPTTVQAGGSPSAPTFYFVGDANLYKITGPMSPAATWQLARGTGTLGRLGWTIGADGSFVRPYVYGVAPTDSSRLYAVDTTSNQIKATEDGGARWYVDDEITRLVTASSLFEYAGTDITTVTAITFDPEDSDTILVGTMQSGIFATVDGGLNWFKVAFSDSVPFVTSFFFDKIRGTIWVSSYGRGLWKFFLERADLRTTIGESADPVAPGQVFTYNVGVRNWDVHMRTARGVRATIFLPDQVSYVSANRTCESSLLPGLGGLGLVVRCEMGDIDRGATSGVELTVQVATSTPNDATLRATASAESSTTYDPNESNDVGTATSTVCFNLTGTCGSNAFGGGLGIMPTGNLISISLIKESNLNLHGVALVELAEENLIDRVALNCIVYRPPGPTEPGGTPGPGELHASGIGTSGRDYYMAFVDYQTPFGPSPEQGWTDKVGLSEDPSGGDCGAGGVNVVRLQAGSFTFGHRRVVIAG